MEEMNCALLGDPFPQQNGDDRCNSDIDDDLLDPDEMAGRPESMPLIHIEGDFNANTILEKSISISNPIIHLMPHREGRIVLPKRYRKQLTEHKQTKSNCAREEQTATSSLTTASQTKSSNPDEIKLDKPNLDCDDCMDTHDDAEKSDCRVSDKWSDRLDDLDVAVKWIRQELVQMRQEDKFLMGLLLDLTARIHLIQGRPSHLSLSANLALLGSYGSDLDIATWSSFMSLDEQALIGRSKLTDSTLMLKELAAYAQDRKDCLEKPNFTTLTRGLRGYGNALGDVLSRSASTRETTKPTPRIKRKNSLPTPNELEEDPFFDGDSD